MDKRWVSRLYRSPVLWQVRRENLRSAVCKRALSERPWWEGWGSRTQIVASPFPLCTKTVPTVLQDPSSKGLQDIPVYKLMFNSISNNIKSKNLQEILYGCCWVFITLLVLQCPGVPCLIVRAVHVNAVVVLVN